jgi:hypothetical protein
MGERPGVPSVELIREDAMAHGGFVALGGSAGPEKVHRPSISMVALALFDMMAHE